MGKGSSQTPTTTNTVQTSLPTYAQPYYTQMMNQGLTQSAMPYQQYQGQQVANTSPFQQAAYGSLANMQAVPGATNMAGQMGTNVGNQASMFGQTGTNSNWTTPGVSQSYMDPYMQNVIQPETQLMNQQQAQNINNINDQAAASGAFGGDRQAIADQVSNQQFGLNLANVQGNLLNQGYQQGANQFLGQQNLVNQGMQTQLGAAGLMNTTGQNQATDSMNWINAMNTAGGQQQTQQQNLLSTNYNNFLQGQNWGWNQLNNFSNIMHGVPTSPGYTSTTAQASPSMTGMLGGLGALAMGSSSGTGQTSNTAV